MSALLQQALERKLIQKEVHGPLLRDVDRIVRDANIPESCLYTSMVPTCSSEEVYYVRKMRKHTAEGRYGLLYEQEGPMVGGKVSVLDRMLAIAGACLRNYTSAKVMVLSDVLQAIKDDTMPTPTVLLVPNFFMGVDGGAPEWARSGLLGMLYSRQTAGQQTVLFVQDMQRLGNIYGDAFKQHLDAHFLKIKV